MLKNLKPISLILLAGILSYPVTSHAEVTSGQPNVDFPQQNGKITGIVKDSFGPLGRSYCCGDRHHKWQHDRYERAVHIGRSKKW